MYGEKVLLEVYLLWINSNCVVCTDSCFDSVTNVESLYLSGGGIYLNISYELFRYSRVRKSKRHVWFDLGKII